MAARGLPVVLGIDLSTTAAKAVVVRADGAVIATGRCRYPSDYRPGGIAEQSADDWIDAIGGATRQALARSGAAARVSALAVASQSITVVPVDATGQPLRAAISWLDTRAGAEAAELDASFPAGEFYRRTGRRPFPVYTLPKLRWLARHEPQLSSLAHLWLLPLPYVMRQLTGEALTDRTIASGTGSFNLLNDCWDDELLGWAGVDPGTMPAVGWPGDAAGGLTARAAELLGLPSGTPVVLGGQDQKVACHAIGLERGLAAVSLGTAAAISAVTTTPVFDPANGLPLAPYVERGRWVLEGVVMTATSALDWLAATLSMPVQRLLALAEATPPGAHGVRCSPHFGGAGSPDWTAGAAATFSGVTLATTAGDLARATVEGVVREIVRNLDALSALGLPAGRLLVTGGGVQSALWTRALADGSQRPLALYPHREVVAVGAAILAGTGAGLWPDAASARAAIWSAITEVEPRTLDQ